MPTFNADAVNDAIRTSRSIGENQAALRSRMSVHHKDVMTFLSLKDKDRNYQWSIFKNLDKSNLNVSDTIPQWIYEGEPFDFHEYFPLVEGRYYETPMLADYIYNFIRTSQIENGRPINWNVLYDWFRLMCLQNMLIGFYAK